MMRPSVVLFAALTLGACTSATTDESPSEPSSTTTTTVPVTTTSSTTPTSTTSTTVPTTTTTSIPPGPDEPFPPDDLVANTWRVGLYFLQFVQDGTFEVRERPDTDPFDWGTWELDGAQLVMTTAETVREGCRPGAVGRYWLAWADNRSRINVTLIDEPCSDRARDMVNGGLPPVDP